MPAGFQGVGGGSGGTESGESVDVTLKSGGLEISPFYTELSEITSQDEQVTDTDLCGNTEVTKTSSDPWRITLEGELTHSQVPTFVALRETGEEVVAITDLITSKFTIGSMTLKQTDDKNYATTPEGDRELVYEFQLQQRKTSTDV